MPVIFKLDNLLKERGISRRELSRLTEIRPQTINDMCNNKTIHLPLENIAKICEVLECEISEILEHKK
jgi:putative transcriptional regulator